MTLDTATTPDAPAIDVVKDSTDVQALAKGVTPVTLEPVIADASQLLAAAPAVVQETRRGYKTTEFYVLIAAGVQDLISTVPPKDKLLITILGGVYALARGIAKNGIPSIVPPEAPE